MNEATGRDILDRALTRASTFPEIIATLLKEDVESYHVDFMRNEVRFYSRDGSSIAIVVSLVHGDVAPEFSAKQLDALNKRVQAGQAGFSDFVKEAPAVGCAHYIVYMNGKKVRYFGRDGGEHIQYFPGAGPQ